MLKLKPMDSAQKIKYSFLKIMTGSDLSKRSLAVMEAVSSVPGPSVWLTGCVHGDEVGGIVVVQEIFRKLKKKPLKKGSLKAFPLMNPIGFETASRHISFSNEDLNRNFPGNPNGSLAERIAHQIFSTIVLDKPSLVLDLHNDWIKSIPYVLVDPCGDHTDETAYGKTIEFANLTGFIVVEEQVGVHAIDLSKTLTGSLIKHGVPAITLELGESHVVNEKNVEQGVTAVWNIISSLNMADPPDNPAPALLPEGVKSSLFRYSDRPVASSSGVIRFMVKPGQIVRKGDKLAKIYNVFGKLQQTILAEKDGLVLGHSDTSVAHPGSPVAAFALF